MRKINIATIDNNAFHVAEKYDLGLEIDELCTAMYIDSPCFCIFDNKIRQYGKRAHVFHAPFSELSPCAIDPKVRELSMSRFNQSYELAAGYGINKIVVHGGFIPLVYYPVWFVNNSIRFWKEYLIDKAESFNLYIENVMESDPYMLKDIIDGIDDKRCSLCLDVGHANVTGTDDKKIEKWLEICSGRIGHFHLHNNDGLKDLHNTLDNGVIDFLKIIPALDDLYPDAEFTIENPFDSEKSIDLLNNYYI